MKRYFIDITDKLKPKNNLKNFKNIGEIISLFNGHISINKIKNHNDVLNNNNNNINAFALKLVTSDTVKKSLKISILKKVLLMDVYQQNY